MPYELNDLLVVGVASSALFDLSESDKFFREKGEDAYREYQDVHMDDTLNPGVAYPFIKRLLGLNDLADPGRRLVEVIVMSRNDPDTGLRVMKSVKSHGLDITRAIFMQGRSPYHFMNALSMSLFLSSNADDVKDAIRQGFAAGQVVGEPAATPESTDLRIAFDFDGVIAGDESEQIMQQSSLEAFHEHEAAHASVPMAEGPLSSFLRGINRVQDVEDSLVREAKQAGEIYNRRLHVAIVTARNAPSHERAIKHLRAVGLRVNDAFFLGGIEKARVLEVLRPHIFFDDQRGNLEGAQKVVPSVHVPFGITNFPSEAVSTDET
ncbi:5'-nucleotidase [Actinomycetaceae bacterium L2_0104]